MTVIKGHLNGMGGIKKPKNARQTVNARLSWALSWFGLSGLLVCLAIHAQ